MKKLVIILLIAAPFVMHSSQDNILTFGIITTDINFGYVESGKSAIDTSSITSEGSSATINDFKFTGADSLYFSYVNNIKLPYLIQSDETIKPLFRFVPTQERSYQAKIEVIIEHSSSAIINVRGNSITGINQLIENGFIIAPNPAQDFIEIELGNNHTLKGVVDNVKIYNFLGEIVFDDYVTPPGPLSRGGVIRIDVSGLAAGVYFVRLGDSVQRFVKY
jgi:hypothetical protein